MKRYVDELASSSEGLAKIQEIYGPLQIGSSCSLILYGIMLAQVYNYYTTTPKDLRLIRYLVLYLAIVETIHSVCEVLIIYEPLVLDFGKLSVTHLYPRALPAQSITMVAISTPIQVFLAWRIRNLQGSIWIPALICCLAAMSFAGGLWTGIGVAIARAYAKTPERYPPVFLWLISAAVADILIAGSLSWSLWQRKSGLPSSNAVVSRIIIFTIQTGFVMSFLAVADVIFLVCLPNIALNWVPEAALVKIYAIQLLSTLNARESLNKVWEDQLNNFILEQSNEEFFISVEASIQTPGSMVFERRSALPNFEPRRPHKINV
ncbi:hypothetical protein CVT25_000955 [Psilocybe cyanescens]|uniref:DUF6534 domain-containing protein n=1 Tax=Psilocybe cyanescens TaxID=93625 RepID=A0A409XSE3_PSICY|nr:hypothetical protein CVT25_000955 [Psilocybe cyanescens]